MLKPLLDRVILKILENKDVTKSGILLSNNLQEKTKVAEVIEVGDGTEKTKMEVIKGQKVVINKYAGIEIKYEDEDLLIVNYNDILAVIN